MRDTTQRHIRAHLQQHRPRLLALADADPHLHLVLDVAVRTLAELVEQVPWVSPGEVERTLDAVLGPGAEDEAQARTAYHAAELQQRKVAPWTAPEGFTISRDDLRRYAGYPPERDEPAGRSRAWQDGFTMCGQGAWHPTGSACDCPATPPPAGGGPD